MYVYQCMFTKTSSAINKEKIYEKKLLILNEGHTYTLFPPDFKLKFFFKLKNVQMVKVYVPLFNVQTNIFSCGPFLGMF